MYQSQAMDEDIDTNNLLIIIIENLWHDTLMFTFGVI